MTVNFSESAVRSTLPRLDDEQSHEQQAEGHRPSSSSQNTGALNGLERLPRELLSQVATDTPEIRSTFRLTSRNLNAIANAATRELNITDRQALGGVIQGRYPTLTSLTINDWRVNISSAEVRAVADNPTLRSLNLDHHPIDRAAVEALAANTTLRSLSLRDGGGSIREEAARALAGNATLTSLDLSDNGGGIREEAARAFAGNATLISLNLDRDMTGDAGAMALAGNPTLRSLSLRDTGIRDAGALALAGNPTLTSLDLRDNNLISAAVKNQLLALALESGRTILV